MIFFNLRTKTVKINNFINNKYKENQNNNLERLLISITYFTKQLLLSTEFAMKYFV